MLTTNGSSNLTCTNSTSLPSLILPLNLPSLVSQSASLAVSSTTSSNIQSMLFNSSTSLESSSLDSTITSTASRNSTDSSDASLEIPDPSLHPQDSTESSLPAENPQLVVFKSYLGTFTAGSPEIGRKYEPHEQKAIGASSLIIY